MNRKGFTLIEALFSIMIIAVIIGGIIRLFAVGGFLIKITGHRISAINLAQAKLEELANTNYNLIVVSNYPTNENVIIDYGETTSSTDDITGTLNTQVINVTDGKKVIVTVTWQGYYEQATETMELVLYNPY